MIKFSKQWKNLCRLQKGKRRNYPKWMHKEAKLARKTKIKMWKRFQQTKSYDDLMEYKIARDKATKVNRNAKKRFEIKLANEVKQIPKRFHAYVRSKINIKDVFVPLRAEDGKLVMDSGKMCDKLHDFLLPCLLADDKELPEVIKNGWRTVTC